MDVDIISTRIDLEGTTDEPLKHLQMFIDPVYFSEGALDSLMSAEKSGLSDHTESDQTDLESIIGTSEF